MHAAHAPASSRHANVAPCSEAPNEKLAVALATVPLGPDAIVVSGATVSGSGAGSGSGLGSGVAAGGSGCAAGSGAGVAGAGSAGRDERRRGSVPAATSRPSLAPSRSVSARRGSVLDRRSS